MAKFACVMLCIFAAKAFAASTSERTALRNELAECFEEYEVKDELINDAKKSHSADNIQPCFLGCALKKIDMIDDKGRYTPEKGLLVLAKFLKRGDDVAKFQDAAQKCLRVNDQTVSDGEAGCQRAMLVINCAIEYNIEIPV